MVAIGATHLVERDRLNTTSALLLDRYSPGSGIGSAARSRVGVPACPAMFSLLIDALSRRLIPSIIEL